jgi:hypothetical protein
LIRTASWPEWVGHAERSEKGGRFVRLLLTVHVAAVGERPCQVCGTLEAEAVCGGCVGRGYNGGWSPARCGARRFGPPLLSLVSHLSSLTRLRSISVT